MQFRSGDTRDAPAIGALWFDSWMSTMPADPAVTCADLTARAVDELSGRWEVTLAEIGERVVGFLAIVPAESRLDQLFVAPDEQGRGIGAALLTVAKGRLPGGFWLKADAANVGARRFYEREGLIVARHETEHGRARVVYAFAPQGLS